MRTRKPPHDCEPPLRLATQMNCGWTQPRASFAARQDLRLQTRLSSHRMTDEQWLKSMHEPLTSDSRQDARSSKEVADCSLRCRLRLGEIVLIVSLANINLIH